MSVLSPHLRSIRTKHAKDRSRQVAETQKLQRDMKVNPLSCCWSVAFNVIAFAAAWKLVQGLTVRSADGAFQSVFVHEGTHLSSYLRSTPELTSLAMDLTVTVTQVGWCAKVLPYLATVATIVVLVVASTLRLRQDPDFLRSVGELGTDLLPGTGDPDLPPPPHR